MLRSSSSSVVILRDTWYVGTSLAHAMFFTTAFCIAFMATGPDGMSEATASAEAAAAEVALRVLARRQRRSARAACCSLDGGTHPDAVNAKAPRRRWQLTGIIGRVEASEDHVPF